jgi:hypothetical protein
MPTPPRKRGALRVFQLTSSSSECVRPPCGGRLPPTVSEPTTSGGYLQDVARISYVDPASLTDPELVEEMAFSQRYGTPRPETQSIRSHVPDVAKAFSRGWNRIFRNGIVEHPLKELCRVYVSESIGCEY